MIEKLFELGQVLHNCVGSYVNKVFDKKCVIVYVTKSNQNLLCIEVRDDLVQQCRADHNNAPAGQEEKVFQKWRIQNRLRFNGNHF